MCYFTTYSVINGHTQTLFLLILPPTYISQFTILYLPTFSGVLFPSTLSPRIGEVRKQAVVGLT